MRPRLLTAVFTALLVPALAGAAGEGPDAAGTPGYGSTDGSPGYDGRPGPGPDGGPGGTPVPGPDGAPGYGDTGGYGGSGGYGGGPDGTPGYGGTGGYGDTGGTPGHDDGGYGDAGGTPGHGEPPPYDRPPNDGMPGAPVLSDAQIVGVLHTVNQGEILAGQQALRKAESPDVLRFAGRMVAEHAALDRQLLDLAGQLGISPEPSRFTQKLEGATGHVLGKLERFSGATFDLAYTDIQLAGHGGLVALLDFLASQATLPQLKAAIDEATPLILSQVEGATNLRKGLPRPIEPGPAGY